jgi:DNA polymerase-1
MNPQPTIYLIDGSAYIHRAYHAIRHLTDSQGRPTNAVFGFTRMLLKLVEDRAPAYVGLFFDAKGPTFRHGMYAAYKANRPPMPEDMALQLPLIKAVVAGFRIPAVEQTGFEADDLIGTVARAARGAGLTVVMVTGDKDFVQLLAPQVSIWDPMKDLTIDAEGFRRDKGIAPHQVVEVMGLSGDSTDNIPGVPGIGPKSALELIRTFGDLETLYARLEQVARPKLRESLARYRDQAFLSRELARIRTDAPLTFDPQAFHRQPPDGEVLGRLFQELEFRQLQQDFSPAAAPHPKDYRAIQSEADLDALIERLARAARFALDTETTSRDPLRASLVGLSMAIHPYEAWYIPCGHRSADARGQLDRKRVLERLRPLLEDPARPKIGQNIKYDWIVLARHGIQLQGVAGDTMLSSYLLNPSKRSHGLDQIALDFLGEKTITFAEVVGKGAKEAGFDSVPLEKAVPYACQDADLTLRAARRLDAELAALNLTGLLEQVELPLIPVLVRMEMRGVRLDTARLRAASTHFQHQLEDLEIRIQEAAGEPFNVKSSQQLGRILFEKLQLPVQKKTRKRTGYSTDVEVLTALAVEHELPALVLRHRTLAKLKSTYADALLDLVHPETGRVHTSFNQTVTATGRLSSSDPNLQNIPVRTDEGREIRRAFIPAEGWKLLSVDYSQVELRILAHCSQDAILIEAFARGEDIHTRTACEVFAVPPEMVTAELRRQAKVINFGIIYGMGAFSLAQDLGIGQKMAKTYIDHYFARYNGVKAFIDGTIAQARQTGRIATLLGRIRLLPDIDSRNPTVRAFAERTAVNTPIQGSAADLIKLAMIRVDHALTRGAYRAAMLLSVHDELVLEVPPEELDAVTALVREIMEGIWELRVPLRVNTAVGDDWAAAH